MTAIVIVESPTKARTIKDFLPKGYKVMASMGHIRDLPQSASEIPESFKKQPWAQLGVNVDKDFEPIYVVPKDKKKVVKELKAALKDADELILASDEDREGESISWHLLEVLKPKIPVKRMVFHEITKQAISAALKDCREINHDLVRAQETRRILDRLVGYTISPLLWKKIAVGLSAGRVQSVSVRMLVEKERERRDFRSGSYWGLQAELIKGKTKFATKLVELGGVKVAVGADFDENTGKIKQGKKVTLLDEKQARNLQNQLVNKSFKVVELQEKASTRKPSPPFITSTLQQEASRKLKLSPRRAMQVAQGLYEKGFITYMRTDSPNLSEQAINAARKAVDKRYGKEYLPKEPRRYVTKSKSAQEAHEAIRPSGSSFIMPDKTGLKGLDLALYELIWKRTVASQMKDAKLAQLKVNFDVDDARFSAWGKRIEFPGFFRAYVEGSDDPDAALEDKEVILPDFKKDEDVKSVNLETKGHQTKPPARYTEASLVKKLESEGIGRPSTYATVIDTIVNRGYVQIKNHQLIPTFVALAVVNLLEKHFPDLVDLGFTAKMEQTLDEIALNKIDSKPYIKGFYSGKNGLAQKTEDKTKSIEPGEFKTLEFHDLSAEVHIGRYGPYLQMESEGETLTVSVPKDTPPAELDQDMVDLIFIQQKKSPEELGIHAQTGKPVFLLNGAYGPYVQLGEVVEGEAKPKRVTLPKGMKESEVDFKTASALLDLPKVLGKHPETGGEIMIGISRFGCYVGHKDPEQDKEFRSLPKEDNIIGLTLERAVEIIKTPKRSRRKAAEPLRNLGKHPDDAKSIDIFVGPYGPYVKHGSTNASIPKDHPVEEVSLEMALDLLAAKKTSKPKKRRATKKR